MNEKVLIRVEKVDASGAELHAFEDRKPKGCPGLGGWKKIDGYWTTRVKGPAARQFIPHIGDFPTMTLDGDKVVSID